MTLPWWAKYVGRRFGRGSECWSLVREVYRDRLAINLPSYGDVANDYVAAVESTRFGFVPVSVMAAARRSVVEAFARGQAVESWIEVTIPTEYDVVLMGGPHANSRRVMHVGIAVDSDRVLHIERSTGSVCVSMRHPSVHGRILGFRRHIFAADRLS